MQAYVRAYESHSLKQIYDVHNLDLKSVGNSFGFVVPPHIGKPFYYFYLGTLLLLLYYFSL